VTLNLTQLEFGSLLTYTPRGDTQKALHSKDVMLFLKRDQFVSKHPVLMSEFIAKGVKQEFANLPFAHFFQPNTILVPAPKSSLMQPDELWVPERIAKALVAEGVGSKVVPCLTRSKPVAKAASSASNERPTAEQHYDSLIVQGALSKPEDIVIIDDVVTRGATLLGCANRLLDAFPQCRIRAFAAMRTISNSNEFQGVYSPSIGTVTLSPSGQTYRRP
jgi:predicted amidophosphoribosyltransferase